MFFDSLESKQELWHDRSESDDQYTDKDRANSDIIRNIYAGCYGKMCAYK